MFKYFLNRRDPGSRTSTCERLHDLDHHQLVFKPTAGELIIFELADGTKEGLFVESVVHKTSHANGYECQVYLARTIGYIDPFGTGNVHDAKPLILRRLETIEQQIKHQGVLMTDVNQQVLDLTAAFDAETTAVAARLDKLVAQAAADAAADAGTIKPETLAALAAVSARLKTLGADPVTPIPAHVPDPVPAPAVTTPAV